MQVDMPILMTATCGRIDIIDLEMSLVDLFFMSSVQAIVLVFEVSLSRHLGTVEHN